ncbi:MAG: hypothetical protein SH821_15725 [Phototrophicales bacterium]|nr:hypothetical protein [Phototrophicales bacterium]
MRKFTVIFFLMSMLLLTACDFQTPGKDASAFLPTLPEYTMTNAVDVVQGVDMMSRFRDLVRPIVGNNAANTIFPVQIDVVQNYLECMMGRVDALAMRFYSHDEFWNSVGMVITVNWDRFSNLGNQLACLVPSPLFADNPELRPCAEAWEYIENNVRYFFFYVGTSVKICDDFKANLPRNA